MATTLNYSWTLPSVGGDTGAWGTILNNAFIAIDAGVKVVADLAAAALPKSGGAMSGKLDLLTSTAKRIDVGAAAGTVNFDLALAQAFTFTVTGNLVVTFTNWPTGAVASAVLFKMTNAGAFTVTWPAAAPQTKWAGGVIPTWTVAGVDRVAFISDDGGATTHGVVVGKAVA